MLYRVQGSDAIAFMSKNISHDETIKRRAIMRQILKGSMFGNSNNDSLDGMRIEKSDYGYIVEDTGGYQTIIGYKLKNAPNSAANTDKDK